MKTTYRMTSLAALAAALGAVPAIADTVADTVALGPPIQLTPIEPLGSPQSIDAATAARAANGNLAVIWPDNVNNDYVLEIVDATGAVVVAPTVVPGPLPINGDGLAPTLVMDAAGNFIVTWVNPVSDQSATINARRYFANGSVNGSDIAVATETVGAKSSVGVFANAAVNTNGQFVVTWGVGSLLDLFGSSKGLGEYVDASGSLKARVYNANGSPKTRALTLQKNGPKLGFNLQPGYYLPSPAMDSQGDFLVAWTTPAQTGLYLSGYSASGTSLGPTVTVDSTANYSAHVNLTTLANGNFALGWNPVSNSQSWHIQDYTSTLSPVGSMLTVPGSNVAGAIAFDPNGNFTIVYDSYVNSTDTFDAQRYAADGTAQGSPLELVDQDFTLYQLTPLVDANNELAVISVLAQWDPITERDATDGYLTAQLYSAP